MKKNINLYLTYYLLILFLFTIFFLYQKHDVANDSTISEWLINYEGGFTKRGLIGQISIYIASIFSAGLRDIIFLFQITVVGIYFYLIYYFFKNLELKRVFVFAIFTSYQRWESRKFNKFLISKKRSYEKLKQVI